MSTMKLAKNGKLSSGKLTRHINIGYFFVTDRMKKDDSNIKHCPTEMMIADFYTKPLQGKFFRVSRNMMMNTNDQDIKNFTKASGTDPEQDDFDATLDEPRTTSQECDENKQSMTVETCKHLNARKFHKPKLHEYKNNRRTLINGSRHNLLEKLRALGSMY